MNHAHKALQRTHNTNIRNCTPLPTPAQLRASLPLTKQSWRAIREGRKVIANIIHGRDPRLLAVVGPCSVHSVEGTLRYARWFKNLRDQLDGGNRLYLIMRLVCVKPRTDHNWIGFFNDPDMNGRCNIEKGWRLGRELLLEVTAMGIPVATEYLDVDSLQRVDDLYSFYWIGARSVEHQDYRNEASGLSTSVGVKNPIHGPLDIAFSTMHWITQRNVLSAPMENGGTGRFDTKGNPDNILILRGTDTGPNYEAKQIGETSQLLKERNLNPRVIVDVNHGNSRKDHTRQADIIRALGSHRRDGLDMIAGIMYESYIIDGNQKLVIERGKRPHLHPDISVTDACDGIERSERTLLDLDARLA